MEVAHEALIREWPTLRAWLAEDRESLRLHRHLTEAARSWQELDCEPGELYRGARLAQALEWHAGHPGVLNELEEDFLAASQAQSEQEIIEREAARQREIETAQRFAEVRAAAGRKNKPGLLRGFAGWRLCWRFCFWQQWLWQALPCSSVSRRASAALAVSFARAGSCSSEQFECRPRTQRLAGPGGCEAHRYQRGSQCASPGRSSLQGETHAPGERAAVMGVDFSKDGKQLATAGADGTARIWDLSSGQVALTSMGHSAMINMVAFSPDGSRLATASDDGTARVWEARKPAKPCYTLSGHAGICNRGKVQSGWKAISDRW